jgi:L-ribulokinase
VNTPHDDRASLEPCVVGVDYGTLSGQAVVVRVADGAELAAVEHPYIHAVLDRELPDGAPLPPDGALQVPADGTPCVNCLASRAVRTPTSSCGAPRRAGPEGAVAGAVRRNISSEWEFAKALQLLEEDPELYELTDRWLEAAVTDKLDHPIGQLGDLAGRSTAEAAAWTGLPEGIAVCVGNVDAHVTAPAATAAGPVGLRGRAKRRRRHLRLVRAHRVPRVVRRRGRRPGALRTRTLTDYAAMTGVELLTIDENTTTGQFTKEVRWNAAHHRLAQAL